jgi:hypothetical protein
MPCGWSCLELEDAAWCVCRTDLADTALQKTLDYACGGGADCKPILQNGACFAPDTVKAHCSYAVNSFYQRNNQNPQACVFSGTATLSNNDPSESTAPPNPTAPFLHLQDVFGCCSVEIIFLMTPRLTTCFVRVALQAAMAARTLRPQGNPCTALPPFRIPFSLFFLTDRDRDMPCCREFVASAFLGTGTSELALPIRAKAI